MFQFEHWCKKHIETLLSPYAESLNIDDLRQDAWLAAYQCLKSCQDKEIGINYNVVQLKIATQLERCQRQYNNKGITYSGQTDIDIQDDIELKAVDNIQPLSSNIDGKLNKWLK